MQCFTQASVPWDGSKVQWTEPDHEIEGWEKHLANGFLRILKKGSLEHKCILLMLLTSKPKIGYLKSIVLRVAG